MHKRALCIQWSFSRYAYIYTVSQYTSTIIYIHIFLLQWWSSWDLRTFTCHLLPWAEWSISLVWISRRQCSLQTSEASKIAFDIFPKLARVALAAALTTVDAPGVSPSSGYCNCHAGDPPSLNITKWNQMKRYIWTSLTNAYCTIQKLLRAKPGNLLLRSVELQCLEHLLCFPWAVF